MTKFSLLKRRVGIDRLSFVEHWRNVHVDVLVNKAGHKAYNQFYVQNECLKLPGFDDERFDGLAQMIPRSAEVVVRGFQEDPLYKRYVRPDEERFLDVSGCEVLYCETQGADKALAEDGMAKAFVLVRRQPAEDRKSFSERWKLQAQESAASGKSSGVLGIRQHWVLPGGARRMLDGEAWTDAPDVVDEFFFESVDDLANFCRAEAFAERLERSSASALGQGSHLFAARSHLVYDEM